MYEYVKLVIFLFNLYYVWMLNCISIRINDILKCQFNDGRLGFEDVVKYLLETHKVAIDLRDASSKTTIFHAVTTSQTPVLRYLLSLVSRAVSQKT